jgi:hypothetical protein
MIKEYLLNLDSTDGGRVAAKCLLVLMDLEANQLSVCIQFGFWPVGK